MIKIAKIEDNLFQVDDNELPIDVVQLRQLANFYGGLSDIEVTKWIESVEEKGTGELATKANTGVVVNIYEVDYPQPSDPNKATQEIAKHLDEYDDAVSQQIFPDTQTEDVIVDLHKNIKNKYSPKRLNWQVEKSLYKIIVHTYAHYMGAHAESRKIYNVKAPSLFDAYLKIEEINNEDEFASDLELSIASMRASDEAFIKAMGDNLDNEEFSWTIYKDGQPLFTPGEEADEEQYLEASKILNWQTGPERSMLDTLDGLKTFISSMEENVTYAFDDYPYKGITLDHEDPDNDGIMQYSWTLTRNWDYLQSGGEYTFPLHGNMVVFWKRRASAERSLFNKLSWLYNEETGELSERWKRKRASQKDWREVLGLFSPKIEINEEDSPETKLYKKILRIANSIQHNGDYGYVYWNPKKKTIWWVAADGDGNVEEGHDSLDMIKEKFKSIDEVKDVIIEAESSPKDEGWIEIEQELVPKVKENNNLNWQVSLPEEKLFPFPERVYEDDDELDLIKEIIKAIKMLKTSGYLKDVSEEDIRLYQNALYDLFEFSAYKNMTYSDLVSDIETFVINSGRD